MPGKQVTLSSGESVTFKPYYSHAADMSYAEIRYAQAYEGPVPTFVLIRALEAALLVMLDAVTKDGQPVAATKDWLYGLRQSDYELLNKTLLEIRSEGQQAEEAEKKMLEQVEAALMQTIGERHFPPPYAHFKAYRAFWTELGMSPTDVAALPEATFRLWVGFLGAEGSAHDAAERHARFLESRG